MDAVSIQALPSLSHAEVHFLKVLKEIVSLVLGKDLVELSSGTVDWTSPPELHEAFNNRQQMTVRVNTLLIIGFLEFYKYISQ
jgi:hypothetical protein